MKRALIGHTGFVGSNLLRQAEFTHTYHRANIESLGEESFDEIVCAGAPAEKWRANANPEADRENIDRLIAALARARCESFVLISTVDVFARPAGVDEDDDADATNAYGRHRLLLEREAAARFRTLIVRLPGLFGDGLKKNAIYDLLHGNNVQQIHPDDSYQFYDTGLLWRDVEKAQREGIALLHVATEPVAMSEVAARFFAGTLEPAPARAPAAYDMQSRHAHLWGGERYLYSKEQVFEGLESFVRRSR